MVNAKQAAKNAVAAQKRTAISRYQALLAKIEDASKSGRFELDVWYYEIEDVQEKLKKLGFTIDKSTRYEFSEVYAIRW
jgi:hypothetical protein